MANKDTTWRSMDVLFKEFEQCELHGTHISVFQTYHLDLI